MIYTTIVLIILPYGFIDIQNEIKLSSITNILVINTTIVLHT